MTLSAVATLIVEVFLPESYQKYLFINYKQSSEYHSYKSFVPNFLHGRPRSVIISCMERQSKSLKYTEEDVCLISDSYGKFSVRGSNGGNHHTVLFGVSSDETSPSCTCRDWTQWHIPCKHFWAVFRFYPSWNWDKLPENYKKSAYLSTDTDALDTFFDKSSLLTSSMEITNDLDSSPGDINSRGTEMDKIPKQKV